MTYSLEIDREISWHKCDGKAKIMFTDGGSAFTYEQEIGLTSARSKYPLFEFNIAGNNKNLLCMNL